MKKHVKNCENAIHSKWQNIHQLCCTLTVTLLLWGAVTLSATATTLDYCPCIDGGYNIGIPNDPSSVTNLGSSGLPAGDVSNACISINGKLRITSDYTFTNCGFVMNEGAEIEVVTGKTLTILNSSLVGCLKMWKGITVTTNGNVFMEHSTVRDAQYAVYMKNLASYHLFNNIFDANYVGFYVASATSGLSSTIVPMAGPNAFAENHFQRTFQLLPPYQGQSPFPGSVPYAGILVNNLNYFTVGSQTDGSVVNYFSNIRNGIISIACLDNTYSGLQISNLSSEAIGVYIYQPVGRITVRNSTMSNLRYGVSGFKCKGVDILDNNVNTNLQGFYLYGSTKGANIEGNTVVNNPAMPTSTHSIVILQSNNGTSPHRVLNNTLTPSKDAISLQNLNGKLVVQDNFISLNSNLSSPYGIFGAYLSGPTTISDNTITKTAGTTNNGSGIVLINSKNAQIANNNIAGTAAARMITGISSYDSPLQLFCCNDITQTQTGTILSGASNDTRFANTIFGTHDIGLQVQYGQISPQPNHGNTWLGANAAVWDARYLGNIAFITSSLFTTNPMLVPNGYTKINVPAGASPSDWFWFQGTDPTCNSQINCGVPPFPLAEESPNDFNGNVLTNADISALTPTTNTYALDQVLYWNTQRYLYQKLRTHPDLINWSAAVTAFYNNAHNGPVGQFYSVHEGIRTLGFPPASMSTSYEQLLQDIATETDANHLDLKLQDLTSMDAQIATWKSNRIIELMAELNAIATTAQYQQNEKDMLLLYLQTVAQDITSFMVAQQSAIDALANQCALDAGPGVYWARMMRQYYEEGWDWQDDCAPLAYRSDEAASQEITENRAAILYPNPASGQVTVTFNEALPHSGSVTIHDLQDRALVSKDVLLGESEVMLPTGTLPNGFYTVKLTVDGMVLNTLKLVIAH